MYLWYAIQGIKAPGCISVMWEKTPPPKAGGLKWACGELAVAQAHTPICFHWHVSHFLNQRERPGVTGGDHTPQTVQIQKGYDKKEGIWGWYGQVWKWKHVSKKVNCIYSYRQMIKKQVWSHVHRHFISWEIYSICSSPTKVAHHN